MHITPPSATAIGEYIIILESYDNNSSVKSPLKTDRITVHLIKEHRPNATELVKVEDPCTSLTLQSSDLILVSSFAIIKVG